MLVAIPLILFSSPLAHSGRVTSVAFSPSHRRRSSPGAVVSTGGARGTLAAHLYIEPLPTLSEHPPALTHIPW